MTNEEYWKIGSKSLDKYAAMVEALVKKLPEPRRSLVDKMMSGPIGEQFMTAPASTRRAFHNAFPCGLVAHSIGVVETAITLASALAPKRWSTEKLIFCGLFHDLGKAGAPGRPYYLPTNEEWKRKRGEFYEVDKEEFMPNSERSLFTLQQHGITLDYEESAAIRLNDGPGAEGNKDWAFHEPDLAMVIHWADAWQTRLEKASQR